MSDTTTKNWPPASSTRTEDEVKAAQRPASTPKATATPDKIIPRTTEGKSASGEAVRLAAKRATTKKAAPAKKQPAKKKAPAKKVATKKGAVNMRALPHAICWKSTDGEVVGNAWNGDWLGARFRIKTHLDSCGLKPKAVKELLTTAAARVREGKGCTIHDLRITCPKQ